MSIFDNIVFDEFTLLEGEQAEAYKKRKAKEKEDREYEDDYKGSRSFGHFNSHKKPVSDKDVENYWKSIDKGNKEVAKRDYNGRYKSSNDSWNAAGMAADAINRHLRKEDKKNK